MRENKESLPFFAGLLVILAVVLFAAAHTGTDFLAHSALDSYTLQAMTWRSGASSFTEDYPWLELAVYEGRYYVSFPPVPTVPMLLLSFFFGSNTPNALMNLLYFLGLYAAAYFLLKRYMRPSHAALFAVFLLLGGSLLDLAVSGDGLAGAVWYQAQLLGLLLTMLAFLGMDGPSRRGWAAGLVCIALAVGCRPPSALYVPILLYMLYRKVEGTTLFRRLKAMLPYTAVPALIAVCYGVYNVVRFGNPFEFGHSYLPEFTNSGEPFFSLSRVTNNIGNILRAPSLSEGLFSFPIFGGFAIYLTNPVFLYGGGRTLGRARRKRADLLDGLLVAATLLHCVWLLTHRTNGGWQYGTRYLSDALPALVYLFARSGKDLRLREVFPMGAYIAFNLYGTILFHYL